jgi:DNA repair exonuclease SbcCD ATPase subunit
MHISKVSYSNLKGATGDATLSPLTIISGRNFSGKTRITDAVRWVLGGKLPELGGRNSDTFKLASASKMGAKLDFDDGQSISRNCWQERGSTKSDCNLSDEEAAQFDIPLLDAAAWSGGTTRERIDQVFRLCPMPEDKTRAGILASLERLAFGEEHSDAIETAKSDVVALVRKALGRSPDPATLPDSVLDAEKVLAEKLTEWNAEAKRTVGFIQHSAELRTREGECSATTLTDLRNEEQRLATALQQATAAEAKLIEQRDAASRSAKRKQYLEDALKEPVPTPKPEPVFTPTVNLEAMQEALAHGIEQLADRPEEDLNGPMEAHDAAGVLHSAKVAEAKAMKMRVEVAEGNLLTLDEMPCCPTCKASKKGWKDQVRATLTKEYEAVRDALTKLETQVQETFKARDVAFATWKGVDSRQNGRKSILADIQRTRDKIQQNANECADYDRALERVRHDNGIALAQHTNRVTEARAELGRLAQQPAPSEDELNIAESKCGNAATYLEGAKQRRIAAERLQQQLVDAAKAAESATKAEAMVRVIKAVKAKVTEIKGELVATAFQTLLETSAEITDGVLLSPLAYHEETSQIGRWTPAGFVSHETFSGSESAITYVAVAAALSKGAKFRVLILDELGRLTPKTQDLVLHRLAACVGRGTLDQVIVLVPSDEPLPPRDGWLTINVGVNP